VFAISGRTDTGFVVQYVDRLSDEGLEYAMNS